MGNYYNDLLNGYMVSHYYSDDWYDGTRKDYITVRRCIDAVWNSITEEDRQQDRRDKYNDGKALVFKFK